MTPDPLAEALGAIREGRDANTLAALLAAWRARGAPRRAAGVVRALAVPLDRSPSTISRVPLAPAPLACLAPCLLAGALGDCLGGPFESLPASPSRLPPPPAAWRVSDDTQLTLATARAIADAAAIDPARVARSFVDAWRAGLDGVGASTLRALRDLSAGQHWALAGASGEFAAGAGAAMRIAPLAFVASLDDPRFARCVRDVASITHRHDEAVSAALAVVRAIQLAASPDAPASRGDVLARVASALPDTRVTDALLALAALPTTATPLDAAARCGASGRASEAVPLALFIAATHPDDLGAALLDAIRCGGDTDTVASIVGQVLGARGLAPPPDQAERVPCRDEVAAVAARWARVESTPGAIWRNTVAASPARTSPWILWLARLAARVHRAAKRPAAAPRARR